MMRSSGSAIRDRERRGQVSVHESVQRPGTSDESPDGASIAQARSLVGTFDPRINSVNALRLILAGLVLGSHTLKLHGGHDPLEVVTGGSVDIGTVAVDGFFALSGFLIVGSWLGSNST